MMRTKKCTTATSLGRLKKAEEFLEDAELLSSDRERRNSAATLYVDAGIAAADVICCKSLGEHAQGPDHGDAIALLGRVDRNLSRDLAVLLWNKSLISYSARQIAEGEFKKIQRSATRLVEEAR